MAKIYFNALSTNRWIDKWKVWWFLNQDLFIFNVFIVGLRNGDGDGEPECKCFETVCVISTMLKRGIRTSQWVGQVMHLERASRTLPYLGFCRVFTAETALSVRISLLSGVAVASWAWSWWREKLGIGGLFNDGEFLTFTTREMSPLLLYWLVGMAVLLVDVGDSR